MAMRAVPWTEHHYAIRRLFSQAQCLLAYNLAFDLRMVNQTAALYGLPTAPMSNAATVDARCLMLDYAEHRGEPHEWRDGYRWHKLNRAAGYEGIRAGQAHRAYDDARLALALMRAVSAQRPVLPATPWLAGRMVCDVIDRRNVESRLAGSKRWSGWSVEWTGVAVVVSVILFGALLGSC